MESSESVKPNISEKDALLSEENVPEEDSDNEYPSYEDEDDDIDDEEFCSSYLKPKRTEIAGGINLKDLYDGRPVTFRFVTSDDEDGSPSEESPEERVVNNINWDSDSERLQEIEKLGDRKPVMYLNEPFKSISRRMFSITTDDCVKKKEIMPGVGRVIPDNCFVVVHYNLFKESSEEPFDSTYLRNRPERINLGRSELILGLEVAIRTMRRKENSRFFIKWNYAFGSLGCPDRIEPKCDIVADVTLLNFKEIFIHDLVTDCGSWFERGASQIRQEQVTGTESFKEGKTKLAIMKFKKSVRMINNLGLANGRHEKIASDLKVKSLVNLAVCYNTLGRHELACVMCQEALSLNPKNSKALFHYARASIALSNFSRARSLLMTLSKTNPNNKDVIEELRKLDKKKGIYEMTTKEFWKRAFTGAPGGAQGQGLNSPGTSSGRVGAGVRAIEGPRPAGRSTEEEGIARSLERNLSLRDEENSENLLDLA